jgi:hypothetical protein
LKVGQIGIPIAYADSEKTCLESASLVHYHKGARLESAQTTTWQ